MSTAPKQDPNQAIEDSSFESLQSHLLDGAALRIRSDVEEAIRKGLIDSEGRRISQELPEEMRTGAERDFGG
jgi:hypothetical protein